MATTTRTLDLPGATVTYDVREPAHDGGHAPLLVVGNPMAADGFDQLVPALDDRLVVTYDPRGTGRSRPVAADALLTVDRHGEDLHAVARGVGPGPFDVFGSSGGAAAALAWAAGHPGEVRRLVAHEPPLTALLADRDVAVRAQADIVDTYRRAGFGPAMAKFLRLVFATEPLTEDFLDQPDPDPAEFGLPTEDDGRRDDLLLGTSLAVMPVWEPPLESLRAATRAGGPQVLPAVGAGSLPGEMAYRGAVALAEALDVPVVVFPGDHGGFARHEWAPDNDPAAFATRLREVLAC
ncbi:alpha/beta fold hydrolase [Isoptericola sp. b408]|uniref:alpha/beta fold hydrolase n=1 Tax=Isoptericola sp. b408 TaxID=3064653 RepID=UPI0027139B1B|nr:alpha/beta fold hydrolase [Isoptericola sp. b408]MDO8150236.1 alpha/beta fold hydrolase [Isoptericola sp. b408]